MNFTSESLHVFSETVPKIWTIKKYPIIVFCSMWVFKFLPFPKGRLRKVFENRVLRGLFGPRKEKLRASNEMPRN
jgi:hypothetical protein